jgi:hypothetical protein
MNPSQNGSVAHPKIAVSHLQRLAYIYVRQSSPDFLATAQRMWWVKEKEGWRWDACRCLGSFSFGGSNIAGATKRTVFNPAIMHE